MREVIMKAEEYRKTYMRPHPKGAYIKEGKKDEMLTELERDFAYLLGGYMEGKSKISQDYFEVAVSDMLKKWEAIFHDQRNKGKKMWRYFYKIYLLPYKYMYVNNLSLAQLAVRGTKESFLHYPAEISTGKREPRGEIIYYELCVKPKKKFSLRNMFRRK